MAKKQQGKNVNKYLFELEDGRTLAELSSEEKNKISARKKSLEIIKENKKT